MSTTAILDAHHNPSVDDLVRVFDAAGDDFCARTLKEAHDPQITARVIDGAEIFTATWTWHSRTLGPRPETATVIQVGKGYSDSAYFDQYVIDVPLTDDDIRTLVRLARIGALDIHHTGFEA